MRNFTVEQDARAKAQQYSRDAHARLEEERIAAVRRGQALESEKASFEVMADESDSALAALGYGKYVDIVDRSLPYPYMDRR